MHYFQPKKCVLCNCFDSNTKSVIVPLKQLFLWPKQFKKVVLNNEVLRNSSTLKLLFITTVSTFF